MVKILFPLVVLSGLSICFPLSTKSYARDSGVKVEQLLQTTHSWEGTPYLSYPKGQPQITILKITIPRNTSLDWHQHPMINAAYVLSGKIILEKKDSRERKVFLAGQALAECVNTTHRGYTTDQPVQLIVFYAGAPSVPLSRKE
jgi:quercetin dioxygenase-like cupin family protein